LIGDITDTDSENGLVFDRSPYKPPDKRPPRNPTCPKDPASVLEKAKAETNWKTVKVVIYFITFSM